MLWLIFRSGLLKIDGKILQQCQISMFWNFFKFAIFWSPSKSYFKICCIWILPIKKFLLGNIDIIRIYKHQPLDYGDGAILFHRFFDVMKISSNFSKVRTISRSDLLFYSISDRFIFQLPKNKSIRNRI